MTSKLAALAVSIALVTIGGAALPAAAADMNGNGHGSVKDRGPAGVPVPAPMPYEEHYKYYIGAGLGWTISRSGDVSATGPGGVDITLNDWDKVGPASLSITAGRYVTPSIRLELGLDLRSPKKIAAGTANFRARQYGRGPEPTSVTDPITDITVYSGPSQNYNVYDVEHSENTKQQTHTLMINALYDFNRGGRLNPYVGAGFGVSLHMLHRKYTSNGSCVEGWNDVFDRFSYLGVIQTGTCHHQEDLQRSFTRSGSTSTTAVGFAAAMMAGVNYKLTDRTHLDVGYRAIWQGNVVTQSGEVTRLLTTRASAGNFFDHEIRTGLRFDLW